MLVKTAFYQRTLNMTLTKSKSKSSESKTRPVSNACLDHIHTNKPQRIQNIVCPNIGLSDHVPVFAVGSFNRNYARNHQLKGNIYIKHRYMKNFYAEQFKSTLKETPWDSVFIFDDIDDMPSSWELLFKTALDSNCPWRVKRVAKARKPPWLNSSVAKQLRERDRLLKIAKRSQNPADWESYKAARNKAVSILRRAKSQFFKTTLEHSKNNPKGIWRTIKSLIGVNKQQSIHHLTIDGHNIVKNKEMAEAFNTHFSTIADKLRNLLPDMLFDTTKLGNFVRSRKDESAVFLIPSITEREVTSYLLKIDSNTSTGIDDISSRMLKLAAPFVALSIAKLINLSFSLNVLPSRWKTAKVTPIFKSGDPADVTNYRPISVLPILSKIIERQVHNALFSFLSENDLLYTRQSGFRPRHSTETALIKVVDDLLFNLDNDCVSGKVLTDYRKAFDMIDHTLLLKKLEVYGLSAETL